MSRAAIVVVLFAVLALPRSALAGSESFALLWSAASVQSPCTGAEAVEEAVVARLGRNPFVAAERADVTLAGRELPAKGGRRRARIEQRDRHGRLLGAREFEAETCEGLTRSAAFVVVLIVDPDALVRAPPRLLPTEPPDKPPAAAANPPPAAPAPLPSPSSPADPAARGPQARPLVPLAPALPILHAGAAVIVASGLLPGGDAGGAVILGLSPSRLPVRFEWRGSYRVSLGAERKSEFAAAGQEWRACYLIRPRAVLGAVACAGGAWSAIFPPTRGLTKGDYATKGVYGPALALGPTFRLGALTLVADVTAFFPRVRWAFSYVNHDGQRRPLYELDRSVLSLTIGVTRSF